jgi:DNA-binding transcriptional MerR regulator
MDIHDTTPTYNLKVVVQETGLRPDTLRAWERRYGLPQPDRRGGGRDAAHA